MTPGARLQAAAQILDEWLEADDPLSRIVTGWGRRNRYSGSGDRRAIADLVHDAVRRMRSAAWTAGAGESATGRDLMIGSLVLDGLGQQALTALFSGARHAPQPLTEAEIARLGRPLADAPRPVRLDFPDWLAPHFQALPDLALKPMRMRAPLFLRANLLKASREEALEALAADGIEARPGPLSPTCIEVTTGARVVARSAAYLGGLVEVQDAASQAAADYAKAAPGETVLDFCAGGGGKTLALAAAMQGQGALYAHDVAPRRLAQIGARADRAGVSVLLHQPGEFAALEGICDLVFVDAPCSGSGAWRRNPDAKWRLAPAGLDAYTASQDEILAQAALAVRPGGRLVYATCSLLEAENAGRVERFLARHTQFRSGRPPLALTPLDGGDGFYACELLHARE